MVLLPPAAAGAGAGAGMGIIKGFWPADFRVSFSVVIFLMFSLPDMARARALARRL